MVFGSCNRSRYVSISPSLPPFLPSLLVFPLFISHISLIVSFAVSAACKRWAPFIDQLRRVLAASNATLDLVSVDVRAASLPWNMAGVLSNIHSVSSSSASVDALTPELVAQLPLTFLVQGFSGKHTPILYSGPRSVESMITFISTHAHLRPSTNVA